MALGWIAWPHLMMSATFLGAGWLDISIPPLAQAQPSQLNSNPVDSDKTQSRPTENPFTQKPPTQTGSNLSLLGQAQAAMRAERYPDAEQLWRQLVRQWPDSAEMSYSLGVALHRQFKIETAAQAYVTATVLNPNHREAHINLSLARIQLGQLEDALPPLEHVLSLTDRPSQPASIHAMAHYNRAVIWGRQGKLKASRAAVDAALAIAPDFREAKELIDLIR